MNRGLVIVAAAATTLLAGHAAAWEGMCTKQESAPSMTPPLDRLTKRICDGESSSALYCDDAFSSARGAQLGEHAYIAHEALTRAGLTAFVDNKTPLFSSFTNGKTFASGIASIAPAAPGAQFARAKRWTNALSELAEVADTSYSLSDFLLGNEHCLVPDAFPSKAGRNEWRDDPTFVNACHAFASHMGAVNSTHFVPQAQSVYELYHQIAASIARRCTKMKAAFDATPKHALTASMKRTVEACEREALAFQAVGTHYLADAWSTGHMWQRWGQPTFAKTPVDRLRAQVTAMTSGMIHGWRSVMRKYAIGPLSDVKFDQLCMPGFFDTYTVEEEKAHQDELVKLVAPGLDVINGGGDLHLLGCLARNQDPRWAVATGGATPLAPQWKRMISCVARGFQEIYELGPKTQTLSEARDLDPVVTSSTSVLCFGARVTNRSMLLGSGASKYGFLFDPSVAGHAVLTGLPSQAAAEADLSVSSTAFATVSADFRIEAARVGYRFARLSSLDPAKTKSADLDHQDLTTFLGIPRNAVGADAIKKGDVPYLENRDPAKWSAVPVNDVVCARDNDCPPATYCDLTYRPAARCVAHEAAVLRAFHDAELPYHCAHDTAEDLEAARKLCAEATSDTDPSCDACAALVLPHVRNACDASGYAKDAGGIDRRSMCDVLQESSLIDAAVSLEASSVYRGVQPSYLHKYNGEGPERVARVLCRMPKLPAKMASAPPPKPLPDLLFALVDHSICVRSCGESCMWCWPTPGDNSCALVELDSFPAPACFPVGGSRATTVPPAQTVAASSSCVVTTEGTMTCRTTTGLFDFVSANVVDLYEIGERCARLSDGSLKCSIAGAAPTTREYWPLNGTKTVPITGALQMVPTAGGPVIRTATNLIGGYNQLAYSNGTTMVAYPTADEIAGFNNLCMRSGGTVTCIGSYNTYGQLGIGSTMPQPTDRAPFPVVGLSDAIAVSVGGEHACAIRSGGSVVCWGRNRWGQLGNGTTTDSSTPVAVKDITDAVAMVSTNWTTCVRRRDRSLACWGWNDSANRRLGDAAFGDLFSATPRAVTMITPSCK